MPLSEKGKKIMENMKARYGKDKGEGVFYATKNAGEISGVEKARKIASGLRSKKSNG